MHVLDSMTIAGWEARRGPDVSVEDHGSMFLVWGNSPAAQRWIANNVPDDAQYFAGALAVEPRYVVDLVIGMNSAGLVVA